jgi:hypothetical protein
LPRRDRSLATPLGLPMSVLTQQRSLVEDAFSVDASFSWPVAGLFRRMSKCLIQGLVLEISSCLFLGAGTPTDLRPRNTKQFMRQTSSNRHKLYLFEISDRSPGDANGSGLRGQQTPSSNQHEFPTLRFKLEDRNSQTRRRLTDKSHNQRISSFISSSKRQHHCEKRVSRVAR